MSKGNEFQWAALYASKGWRIVPCHGMENGQCTCTRGAACATPGKHPVLGGWQHKSTTDEDELADIYDGSKVRNVGVQLGERSGIIDIEYDDEQGLKTATFYELDKCQTPTFTSKRSTHRIFKWDKRLPQQAVFKLEGLEVRIGGGEKGSQSIFPPSMHHSGTSYAWVPGMGPDEVEVAEIPKKLLLAIINDAGGPSAASPPKDRANSILHGNIGEGGRNNALMRFAARACINMLDPHDPLEQQDTLQMIQSVNREKCKPPLDDSEVATIWRSELAWAIRTRGADGIETSEEKKAALKKRLEGPEEKPSDKPKQSATMSLTGLEYRAGDGDSPPEYWPGQWRLVVQHSDPVVYLLHLPVFVEMDGRQETVERVVTLDPDTYMCAGKVAKAILAATHTVIVNSVPEEWAAIWNGKGARKGQKAIRGLFAKLMETAEHRSATPENCRFAEVAGWLLGVLSAVPEPDEDDDLPDPDPSGSPCWHRASGNLELLFKWGRAWELANSPARKITRDDILKVERMILSYTSENALDGVRRVDSLGKRGRYIRFTKRHLEALGRIAGGEYIADHVSEDSGVSAT